MSFSRMVIAIQHHTTLYINAISTTVNHITDLHKEKANDLLAFNFRETAKT